MHTKADKERFLEELRKTPVVQVACQKVGWGRTTYYRIRKQDKHFAELADVALQEGRVVVNELGEAQTITLMKEKDMRAIRFWLTHNDPRYSNKLEIKGTITNSFELTPEMETLMLQAGRMALPQQSYDQPEPKEETEKDEDEESIDGTVI